MQLSVHRVPSIGFATHCKFELSGKRLKPSQILHVVCCVFFLSSGACFSVECTHVFHNPVKPSVVIKASSGGNSNPCFYMAEWYFGNIEPLYVYCITNVGTRNIASSVLQHKIERHLYCICVSGQLRYVTFSFNQIKVTHVVPSVDACNFVCDCLGLCVAS